jgi:tetratricopeptide (TPR) repeat protein
VTARREGRARQAVDLLERSLARDPADRGCYVNLTRACLDAGQARRAEQCVRSALERWPDSWQLWDRLSTALGQRKRFDEAVDAARKAVDLQPERVEALLTLGAAQYQAGDHQAALQTFDAVIARDPGHVRAHHNRATLLKLLGRKAECIDAYRRTLQLEPTNMDAWRSFVDTRKFTADDPDRFTLERLFDSDRLGAQQRMNACFALGKIYEDIGQDDRAFWCYREGNRLKRGTITFDVARSVGRMAETRRVFSARLLAEKSGRGNPDPSPIFIVGMPRSGTTLVEQILASHPDVGGAGELYDLSRIVTERVPARGHRGRFPQWVPELSDADLARLGGEYVEALRRWHPDAPFVTDKMPANFRFVGLIRLILPNAKIIHTRRHPADTCLSCFTKLFVEGQEFSFDLRELGRYYRAYEELMAHWRGVLDPGDMLEVAYERLVDDTETQARRLLKYCGLPWDEACLRFHETERMVATASSSQVRRPVYTSSVQRWRRFADHLDPLFQAMAQGYRDSGPA